MDYALLAFFFLFLFLFGVCVCRYLYFTSSLFIGVCGIKFLYVRTFTFTFDCLFVRDGSMVSCFRGYIYLPTYLPQVPMYSSVKSPFTLVGVGLPATRGVVCRSRSVFPPGPWLCKGRQFPPPVPAHMEATPAHGFPWSRIGMQSNYPCGWS
jgi:hypothetical protein